MSNRSSRRAMGTGLIILVLAVSAGVHFVGGSGGVAFVVVLLLSFAGVLAGASVVAVGVLLADDPAGTEGGAGALTAMFMRRNLAFAGLAVASSASAAVAGETGPAFCFGAFVLLLLGLALINIRLLLGA